MTEYWRALLVGDDECCELLARLKEEYDRHYTENERLRARIIELEAALVAVQGTVQPTRDGGMPFTVEEVPPSTPR